MIPFIDLQAQRLRLGQPLEDAILKVVRSGAYVMGPEIAELEARLAAFVQAPFALTCGSGTDALALPLMAWGIGPGDAVFCPSFTFAATAEVVPWFGAEPVVVAVLSAHRGGGAPARAEAGRRFRPGVRLHLARPPAAGVGRRHHDQLLPGQA